MMNSQTFSQIKQLKNLKQSIKKASLDQFQKENQQKSLILQKEKVYNSIMNICQ